MWEHLVPRLTPLVLVQTGAPPDVGLVALTLGCEPAQHPHMGQLAPKLSATLRWF
ncbi:hypothetical protein NC653_034074 [Populus alba x Populus x berolinensis]|uniref:Uncharacterized protein n=1 Tax=Populus alba x Populus x berolinensis TaxID=444605 RepID=A0AAD6LLY7_9ROSI|nr:hypothetical protein NC653_034074 [Populus alba x Populus x berolinensis]